MRDGRARVLQLFVLNESELMLVETLHIGNRTEAARLRRVQEVALDHLKIDLLTSRAISKSKGPRIQYMYVLLCLHVPIVLLLNQHTTIYIYIQKQESRPILNENPEREKGAI